MLIKYFFILSVYGLTAFYRAKSCLLTPIGNREQKSGSRNLLQKRALGAFCYIVVQVRLRQITKLIVPSALYWRILHDPNYCSL